MCVCVCVGGGGGEGRWGRVRWGRGEGLKPMLLSRNFRERHFFEP